jgi:hypothetical protein
MSFTSKQLQMTLQNLDDNPDTWGDVLNQSGIELIEDAVAGQAEVVLSSPADYTMDTTIGGDATDHYRKMIINVTGSPGGATNILVPDDTSLGAGAGAATGIYLAFDGSTGGSAITLKTVNGTGVVLVSDSAVWCYCDGTNIVAIEVENAVNATNATTATDSTQLGGVVAASYAQLDVQNTWTKGQAVARAAALTDVGNIITPDISESNSFYAVWAGNYQLAAPDGSPQNGQQYSIAIQQAAAGGPFTISYAASTYIWEGGSAPVLSVGASEIDYLGFEYCTNLVGGARWIGSIIKGLS